MCITYVTSYKMLFGHHSDVIEKSNIYNKISIYTGNSWIMTGNVFFIFIFLY